MILIIEAGGTKSNLAFVENGQLISSFVEHGIQLSRETLEDFEKKMQRWSEFQQGNIESIFLFAAGKVDAIKEQKLKDILSKAFRTEHIQLHSDLLAACFATAGNQPGIVGILGTGSNSCYYDGQNIIKNVSPGGFILGDEGSGTDLGKKLLIHYLREDMPSDIRQELIKEYGITSDLVIQNIYGGSVKDAAWFCSGFAPFITSRLHHPLCLEIATNSVKNYLSLIVKAYSMYSNQLNLVGSIAFYLKEIIITEARRKNIEIVKITQHPINDLTLYLTANHSI